MASWYTLNKERARAVQKKWRAANPEKMRAKHKRYYERHKHRDKPKKAENLREWRAKSKTKLLSARAAGYGLSLDDYHELLRRQDGHCAVCPATECHPGKGNALAIDHLHVDGYETMTSEQKRKYVRGLLCFRHNSIAGEHPDTLRKIADYVEAFRG